MELYLWNGTTNVKRFTTKRDVAPRLLDIAAYTVQGNHVIVISNGVTILFKKVNGHIFYDGGFYSHHQVSEDRSNKTIEWVEYELTKLPKGYKVNED